jgi:hypothetical protein
VQRVDRFLWAGRYDSIIRFDAVQEEVAVRMNDLVAHWTQPVRRTHFVQMSIGDKPEQAAVLVFAVSALAIAVAWIGRESRMS